MDSSRKNFTPQNQASYACSRRSALKLLAAGAAAFCVPNVVLVPKLAYAEQGKLLIAYYSRTGTTRQVATMLHGIAGGDLQEIKPVIPYPEEYTKAAEISHVEYNENARPAIKTDITSIDAYTTVALGYPIWFGTMPMLMWTFLEKFDFTGKTILPFCTSGGSGLANSIRDIQKLCPGAQVLPGLDIMGAYVDNAKPKVEEWLRANGIIA